MDRPDSRPAGRPRDADADDRIIDAALAEYAAHGHAGYSLNGVARRAGVGKSSIYLRWSDKESLLVDAVHARTEAPDADTGSLRGDLEAVTAWALDYVLSSAGWVTVRIAIDGADTPNGGPDPNQVGMPHLEALRHVWERAVARGELSPEAPTEPALAMLYGSLIMGGMLDRQRLQGLDARDRRVIVDQVVSLVLRALGSD